MMTSPGVAARSAGSASEVVQAAIPMPVKPDSGYLIQHDGAPWYVDHVTGALVRIDPEDGSPSLLRVRMARPLELWGVSASTAPGSAGRLWVRHGNEEAWLIDTRADRVLRRVAVADGGGGDLQEVGGELWIAHFGDDKTQRISLGDHPS
jgi:streptogramin lyase